MSLWKQIPAMVATMFISVAPSAFACLEWHTSVTLVIRGSVAPGRRFQQEISPSFYFRRLAFGNVVKVRQASKPPIYFWLTPEGRGWSLGIGPRAQMVPDYITVTSLPYPYSLRLSAAAALKGAQFCFTMEPEDYKAAVDEVSAGGKSGIIEILSVECRENEEGVGHGLLTATALSRGRITFKADLKIPVYTTDCP